MLKLQKIRDRLKKRSRRDLHELRRVEFVLLVVDMPWAIFPFVHNPKYSKQANAAITDYFSIVKKTDPEIQARIQKIYVDFLKVIAPHKADLYNCNFDIKKAVHTEESLAAAKLLYNDIISFTGANAKTHDQKKENAPGEI